MSNEVSSLSINEIVKYQWQDTTIELTKEDVRNLISTSKDVTDKEVMLFLQLCKYQKLNPFVREAYLIKYGSYPASMVVGKEVFTKRAEDNPNFDGYDITDNWKAGIPLEEFEVTCKVYRKNLAHPITVTVSYPEYVGTDKDGNVNRMWKGKPRTMLRKVSLMQGLREAFPTALGGLYEENELDQQTIPKDIMPKEEKNETVNVLKEYINKPASKLEKKDDWASEKQVKLIKANIIASSLITKPEKSKIQDYLDNGLTKMKASEIISWWIGDIGKGITGERQKRNTAKPDKGIDKPAGTMEKFFEEENKLIRQKTEMEDDITDEDLGITGKQPGIDS